MIKSYFCLTILLFSVTFSFAQKKSSNAVLSVMVQQQKDWNNGNVESFMQGYWKSDSLQFVGSKSITYGWQQTLDNYKKNYSNKALMGNLQFSDLQIQELSKTCCFVIGTWHLKRNAGDIGGHFTLLFKKINGKWVIVVDHTS